MPRLCPHGNLTQPQDGWTCRKCSEAEIERWENRARILGGAAMEKAWKRIDAMPEPEPPTRAERPPD